MGVLRGRGTAGNPKNRFERAWYERVEEPPVDADGEPLPLPRTEFIPDRTQSLITYNKSPDLGFDASINPYRGCEHGCVYCHARPYHEYLGYSAGLDFETKIVVKHDAPEILRRELASPKWRPQVIAMSGVTDVYQPIERRFELSRGCLSVLAGCRNPVSILTKNHLVTRDLDLLVELANHNAAAVSVSVTTLDPKLARIMEPRTSMPARRLAAIRTLHDAGLPVSACVAPIIPGLTDTEIPAIVRAVTEAGAQRANYMLLRLPHGVKGLFAEWLQAHFPGRANKVLNRLLDARGGRLDDSRFGFRHSGEGHFVDQIGAMFKMACRRAGLTSEHAPLNAEAFRPPGDVQLGLFR